MKQKSTLFRLTQIKKFSLIMLMYLLICPTELESASLSKSLYRGDFSVRFLVSGFGMVESAITLVSELKKERFSGVILFGLAGAYPSKGAIMLDICLATSESFGDLGLAQGNEILPFDRAEFNQGLTLSLSNNLLVRAKKILDSLSVHYKTGNFVTVNSVSATKERADNLALRFDAICENMEGAAIARVCQIHAIPLLEIRCVSNMAGAYNKADWRLKEAVEKICDLVDRLMAGGFFESD